MTPAGWIAVAAVLALLLGLWLMLAGRGMRQRRGPGSGKTVSLDRVTLTSQRLGLSGRPDRLIKADGTIIVEEWKSSRSVWPNHKAQMAVYFLLIEDQFKLRPTHGFHRPATARGTASTMRKTCGPGCSTWPTRFGLPEGGDGADSG